ncbi:probable protein phosphatase 2C 75 [Andrographis paniculata]|uniref:probable protein phosphatase 2C 75 n=1 Tax=Andrographis paniculata TaxID=175694 RepID=UPI0021E8E124|nr:probable protein phosphatase 2C 75 [Andrographis paniculata]XP_051113558.1 probable protein phosphatase 2C 75 [Andrographis paniculata]
MADRRQASGSGSGSGSRRPPVSPETGERRRLRRRQRVLGAIGNLSRDPMTFSGHLDDVSGPGGAPRAASSSRGGLPSTPDIRSVADDDSGAGPSRQPGAAGGEDHDDGVVVVGRIVRSGEARFPPPNAPSRVFGGPSSSSAPPRVPPPELFRSAAMALIGSAGVMEDAVSIRKRLCSPAIARFKPVHYVGVFDGHGGSHCANMCKSRMHEILREEMDREAGRRDEIGAAPSWLLQEAWTRIFHRCFRRIEVMATTSCRCGSFAGCDCDRTELLFSGTTAVAVVLTAEHIVAAHCGDSRAILCRTGRIIPLTHDHKPDRQDERERIEAAGGLIIETDTARVQGVLSTSRAIGDWYLKPYVISEPEVRLLRRDREDEFVIIATDGLWDVMPVGMVIRVVSSCFLMPPARDEITPPPGTTSASVAARAAALLMRLAVARNCDDNIAVVVVDLRNIRPL